MGAMWRHLASLLLCAIFGAGCSDEDPIPEEEVPVLRTQVTELQVPPLLTGQSVQVDGRSREIGFEDFEDSEAAQIEIHEISPKAADGSYTATVSFNLSLGDPATPSPDDRIVRATVEIIYEIRNSTIQGGHIILTYPVREVKTLAVEPVPEDGN